MATNPTAIDLLCVLSEYSPTHIFAAGTEAAKAFPALNRNTPDSMGVGQPRDDFR